MAAPIVLPTVMALIIHFLNPTLSFVLTIFSFCATTTRIFSLSTICLFWAWGSSSEYSTISVVPRLFGTFHDSTLLNDYIYDWFLV